MRLLVSIGAAAAALMAVPAASAAFCGFYVSGAGAELFNNATQVVLMRQGTRTVLSMQNNYQGPPEDFAMVVPVPVVLQKENVKTLPREIFRKVDTLAAPRLVEYWEQDPCAPIPPPMPMAGAAAPGGADADGPGAHGRPRREDRGAVHGRRVPDRHPVGHGLDRAGYLAAAGEVLDPGRAPSRTSGRTCRAGRSSSSPRWTPARSSSRTGRRCCRRCASTTTPRSSTCRSGWA